ncbi:MAG: ATP-binding cassette domain-containing protein, partial [Clostridium sp.]|nr:ATP-binding cassette domain-containing protein [Clostridium sp.]
MSLTAEIHKKFSGFRLDISVAANNNIVGLLGASGSGKSMTLRCIAGIETPDSGRIVLNDRILYDSEKKINLPPRKRRVGYLF